MTTNSKIAIFDSGIGGLTVAKEIVELLPNENILYFGDTAHLPYGDKSESLIKNYVSHITEFLLQKDVKMIVIACNSASTFGANVAKKIAANYKVIDVVSPTVDYVLKKKYRSIGIIGTQATISSHVYQDLFYKNDIQVKALATPLLAPMIEEGFVNNLISHEVINQYLASDKISGIEALILGCTHYPLIENEINDHYKGSVDVINSAKNIALEVKRELQSLNLLRNTEAKGKLNFIVSDYTQSFKNSAKYFFGEEIELTENRIWEDLN